MMGIIEKWCSEVVTEAEPENIDDFHDEESDAEVINSQANG